MMQLTFLGSGTSTGVPTPLCDCEVCRSSDPRDKRLRASVLVEADGRNILIDCGPDFRYQALRAGISRIDAVLVTHSHYDHAGGFDDLRPFCALMPDNHLPVYCKHDVAEDFLHHMPYCFKENPYPNVPQFTIHEIDNQPFDINSLEITPLPVMHHDLPILGFRIGDLAYVTDCKTMPESTRRLIRGIDTLVINALRFKDHHSHMNIPQALELISDLKPRRTFLTHASHGIGLHASTAAFLPENVEYAFDTLSIRI